MDTTAVGIASGAAGTVAFVLQWARAHQSWPEWANALVVLAVAVVATALSTPLQPLHPFLAALGTVLAASGAGGYLASTASHLPLTSKVVPKSNTKTPDNPDTHVSTVTT